MNIEISVPTWLLWAMLPVALVLLFEQVWVHYLAVMNLKQVMAEKGLRRWSKFFGFSVVLPVGLFLDWIGNLVCTLVFMDLPGRFFELITGRLQRYEDTDNGWRRRFEQAFAEDMLNDFDLEPHIKPRKST